MSIGILHATSSFLNECKCPSRGVAATFFYSANAVHIAPTSDSPDLNRKFEQERLRCRFTKIDFPFHSFWRRADCSCSRATNRFDFILMMPRFNCYVVFRGRRPGIYNTWTDCKAQVNQFPDAL
ncbi:hypothetical protein MRB53_005738 [Persea americana]|uniref:Uncharacterized protein n=1 Tax=Persea americana TaxID=3435 RepID=A0ACC2ME82_PERAE|nr:hypothetical protein MRB53_005738 [Persea americana]